jgi:hypothetical protein
MSANPSPSTPGFWDRTGSAIGWSGFGAITGGIALVLTLGQLAWPLIQNAISPYSVRGIPPDETNLFCMGSEGESVLGGSAPCTASSPLTVMVKPLSYINEAHADKSVWLRHEFVTVTFLDEGKNLSKGPFILSWDLVKSSQSWEPPGLVSLKPGETISHSTLFYPSSYGCKPGVQLDICLNQNTYLWIQFAKDVLEDRIKFAVLNFAPDFIGPPHSAGFVTPPNSIAPSTCELTFDKSHVSKLSDPTASHYIVVRCNETPKA